MRGLFFIHGAIGLVGLLIAQTASAQQITMNAVAYDPIPSGVPVMVEIFDDSDENMTLKAQFEKELQAAGYTVSNDAQLVLSFETRGTSGTWIGGGSNRLISIGNSQDHSGTDAPDVRVRIFDNQTGGILNRKRGQGVTQVTPSQYRIDASIEDRSNGKRLWQGWGVADAGGSDDPSVHQSMVGPIVGSIGQTIRDEHIRP